MRKPSMPKFNAAERITPMPDIGGAQQQQSKFDALKQLMDRRGRSSTLKTFYKKRSGDVSGRLSDVPTGGRESTDIVRGI
jgi:hypothetical protein